MAFRPATEYATEKRAAYPYDVPETVNWNVWVEPSNRTFIRKPGYDAGWDWYVDL